MAEASLLLTPTIFSMAPDGRPANPGDWVSGEPGLIKWALMTNLLSLDAVEQRVRSIASQLTGLHIVLPTFGRSDDSGRPHIEIGATYDLVVRERGVEFERRSTRNLDELLYWIFASVTFSSASDYGLEHRSPEQSFRRILFAKQVELLALLAPEWGHRRAAEHDRILADHPFVDE